MEESRKRLSNESHAVLGHLDPQRFTSQIPMAVNGRRRNSTASAIGGAGLSELINRSMAKNKPEVPKRSYTDSRRSLIADRKSLRSSQRTSLLPNHGLNSANTTNTNNKDPRPLRDKNFQVAIQQEIYDYLHSQKFDVQTNHPISLKSLRQPTQKDFVFIFRWLYQRMDPGYKFSKSIEHEVYTILRAIQYPYLETINKSQISAVGGSSWPKFLGMLHWLVNINKRLDSYLQKVDLTLISQNTQDITVLQQPIGTIDEQEDKQEKYELIVERLFIDYIVQSYKSFLRLDDDYDQYMKELELGFEKFAQVIRSDIANIGMQNSDLSVKYQELVGKGQDVKVAKDKFNALRSDLTKFQNYVNAMQHKSQEWPKKLEKMETERENKMSQLKATENQITEFRDLIKGKNIEIAEVDRLNAERERLTRSLDSVSTDMDQAVSLLKAQKMEAESAYKTLLDVGKQYESAVESLVVARLNLGHQLNTDNRKISLPDTFYSRGYEPGQSGLDNDIPPEMDVRGTIKPKLLELNEEVRSRVQKLQQENASFEAHLENLKQEISEKTRYLESLENELSIAKSQYDEQQQESQSHLLSQRIEIEKMERKLQNVRYSSHQKIAEAEQKVQSTKLKYEELKLAVNRERNILHGKVIQLIDYVSDFKINVQSAVEDLDYLAIEELNKIKFE
ncbi:kinetochore-associated Ndc80 complex subunit NDC80 [Lachancea thermotolerans CBS 6340]|uniref:Kinetochore protein NDC80 n=1 Tax=Lachancea thermotolerans (strain ATCC 56472 / CBS 6340 / NRRL Y-8284) TaxID=559295 RepID=C5DH42_LACTC|nr:KLTH0E01188p [Lachancea thermotolerans CBS 6340]CAR23103.1 KLTH0E01188p [Lachancea thermotolerans CBS 6340]